MTAHLTGGRRWRRLTLAVAAALLALVGTGAIALAVASQQHAPQPPAGAARSATPTSHHSAAGAAPPQPNRSVHGPVLPASRPTAIAIPAIQVRSDLVSLGQNPDGTVQVPQPGPDYNKAAWYRYSPAPGQAGPSVILGHIDSAEKGPSVFFRLGDLRKGNRIVVSRADHHTAVFRVARAVEYPKNDFPTFAVYGNTDSAQLRLITCGGSFDRSERSYRDNIVIYATLTGSR